MSAPSKSGDVCAGLAANRLEQIGDRAQRVVLPAPLAPSSATISPADVEIHVRESDDRAIVDDP